MIGYDCETSEWVGAASGHREYAHTDRLSVDDNGETSYGYDGGFDVEKFSLAERRALADIMIERWNDWKEQQK